MMIDGPPGEPGPNATLWVCFDGHAWQLETPGIAPSVLRCPGIRRGTEQRVVKVPCDHRLRQATPEEVTAWHLGGIDAVHELVKTRFVAALWLDPKLGR